MEEPKLYSPYPPVDYSRKDAEGVRFGIGAEMQSLNRRALWNLYWLSDPNVDSLLADDVTWSAAPAVDYELLEACGGSLNQRIADETVGSLVMSLPAREFVRTVHMNDHAHLKPFALRGAAWLHTISQRAAGMIRGRAMVIDGVVWANFGRKESKTKSAGPSTITPIRGNGETT